MHFELDETTESGPSHHVFILFYFLSDVVSRLRSKLAQVIQDHDELPILKHQTN